MARRVIGLVDIYLITADLVTRETCRGVAGALREERETKFLRRSPRFVANALLNVRAEIMRVFTRASAARKRTKPGTCLRLFIFFFFFSLLLLPYSPDKLLFSRAYK